MTALLPSLAMGVVAIGTLELMRRDYRKAKQHDANVRFWDEMQEWMDEENPTAGSRQTMGSEAHPEV